MVRSLLRESLEDVPIVDKGGYQYFVHPLTDGANAIEPLLLEEVTLDLMKESTFDCDKIVTVEAMGILWTPWYVDSEGIAEPLF